MPRTIETEVYRFEELSDSAKERARDWWRRADAGDNYFAESVIEDAVTCGGLIGIEIGTHPVRLMSGKTRRDPSVYWSGFSSQDDGACFEGRYAYVKGAVKAIREHAPCDATLANIADRMAAIQRRHFYRLESNVAHCGRYSHEHCTEIDVTDSRTGNDVDYDTAESVRVELRRFMQWVYCQLEAEYNYRMSDEQVDESIMCNDYEFNVEGDRV